MKKIIIKQNIVKEIVNFLNIKDYKIRMLDQDVDISITGHYTTKVLPERVCTFDSVNHILIFETNGNINLKMLHVIKPHYQFGCGFIKNLKNLLKFLN